MPDDRMIHRRLGHSAKVRDLTDLEFRVWIQYLLSADDFGVMRLSSNTIQANNDALDSRPAKTVQRCLDRLVTIGLARAFEHQNRRYLYQPDWQDFQHVAYPRTTEHPRPPDDALVECSELTRLLFSMHPGGAGRVPRHLALAGLSMGELPIDPDRASERQLEGLLANALPVWLGADVRIETQVRFGNLYCDLVATTKDFTYAIEVKRNPITDAAVRQARRYAEAIVVARELPLTTVIPVVVGRGGLSLKNESGNDAVLVICDDEWTCRVVKTQMRRCYLTDAFSLINVTPTYTRAGETANANGYRLEAHGSEGGLGETKPTPAKVTHDGPRLRVWDWQHDDLARRLGGKVDAFDLLGWYQRLETELAMSGESFADPWKWLQYRLYQDAKLQLPNLMGKRVEAKGPAYKPYVPFRNRGEVGS